MTVTATAPSQRIEVDILELTVRERRMVADGVVLLTLVLPGGGALPPWEPCAHIELLLDDHLVRQYSLCGDPEERDSWQIAVLLDPATRGGSARVHQELLVGDGTGDGPEDGGQVEAAAPPARGH